MLAELKGIENEFILKNLRNYDKNFKDVIRIHTNRTFVFHSMGKSLKKIKDGNYYSAFLITEKENFSILLITLHLPSRLYRIDEEIGFQASRVKIEIEKLEEEFNIEKTIVVGDFNLNPFSNSMVSSFGFNAVMSKEVALKIDRTIDKEKHKYFFNPLWSLHGNVEKEVLGTYYHHKTPISFVWNMFDQILIRPHLIEQFDFKGLEIIHDIGSDSLLNDNGTPNNRIFSDHLPLKFRINLEDE